MPQIGIHVYSEKIIDEQGQELYVPTKRGTIWTDRDCTGLPCDTPIEPLIKTKYLADKYDFVQERLEEDPSCADFPVTLKGGYPPIRCSGRLKFLFHDAEVVCPVCGCVYEIYQSG